MSEHEKKSMGVVACDGNGKGLILWARGMHLQYEIEENGFLFLDDLGLDDAPSGISIWEGVYRWAPHDADPTGDGESSPVGEFRNPTDNEWEMIRKGLCPWKQEDMNNG